MVPAILDIEASGFGRGSYPIEVGYVLSDGRSHCMLVRPEPEWTAWDPEAEQLHGISREQLLRSGRSVAEVARCLNHNLDGKTLYSDAWGNDQSWLALLFDSAGTLPRFRLESLRSLLSEGQVRNWRSARQAVVHDLALQRHRASSDARILQETFLRSNGAGGLRLPA